MGNTQRTASSWRSALKAVRGHLLNAQALMDEVEPNSVLGARLQELIDAVQSSGSDRGRS